MPFLVYKLKYAKAPVLFKYIYSHCFYWSNKHRNFVFLQPDKGRQNDGPYYSIFLVYVLMIFQQIWMPLRLHFYWESVYINSRFFNLKLKRYDLSSSCNHTPSNYKCSISPPF